ncbi:hypothetical protein BDV98DRAFT_573220 [Pterulicium gracile]|uniref:DUF6534 domain-containing protein n=1 Tax=Pterulicium gracile TaxID=1884261 RepID=A0A5C3QCM3_9AGAR|nr:hypothetical protein BDV98DRAFT_573220 [Pterula gracilis]
MATESSNAAPEIPNLGLMLGPTFIGLVAASMLFGITSLQTQSYFRGEGRDTVSFRVLMGFLWVFDAFHLVLLTICMYHYLISNFGDVEAALLPTWSIIGQIFMTCISNFIVRTIFGVRVWILSGKNVFWGAALAGATLFTFGSGLTVGSLGFGRTFAEWTRHSIWLYLSHGTAVFSDVVVAGSLVYFLRKRRTGVQRADSILATLMSYAVNTCLLTSLCSITTFVTFAVWPHYFIFMGFQFILSKLYLNALLASLNARDVLFQRVEASGSRHRSVEPHSSHMARTYYPDDDDEHRHSKRFTEGTTVGRLSGMRDIETCSKSTMDITEEIMDGRDDISSDHPPLRHSRSERLRQF